MINTAIIGLQWGDEGKGKIVDFLSDKFNAVVRFQGGHNAGHTIKVDDKTFKLSLLPSGIIRGKFSVIGSGVVVDPIALFSEIEKIEESGIKISQLLIIVVLYYQFIVSLINFSKRKRVKIKLVPPDEELGLHTKIKLEEERLEFAI